NDVAHAVRQAAIAEREVRLEVALGERPFVLRGDWSVLGESGDSREEGERGEETAEHCPLFGPARLNRQWIQSNGISARCSAIWSHNWGLAAPMTPLSCHSST